MSTRPELLTRALRLHHELHTLRKLAHELPLDDVNRFRYSIRAGIIGKQLKAIMAEHEREKV